MFLIPSLLTSAATSLNNFLDSIVVAQTLGSSAMSMVNMASPILFVMSAIYVLFGGGGSTVYAFLKGKMEKEKASKAICVTLISVGTISIFMAGVGLIFSGQIAGYLSGGQITGEFTAYIRVTFLSALVIVPLQTLLSFYPANGFPAVATIVNIVVNVVNIFCDYLLTAYIPLGVKGSAYATLIGYIVGAASIGILSIRGKYRLPLRKCSVRDLALLKDIVGKGAAVCISQVGFCIKVSFSNKIAMQFVGSVGVTVFSVCFQTVSMISIVMGGILHSMTPIIAALHGMKDHNGIRFLMKTILLIEVGCSTAFFILLEVLPTTILSLYHVDSAEAVSLGIEALRIFAIMHVFRGTVLAFLYYYQTIGAKLYSVILSVLDGFAGVIPLALILCRSFGIDGLWMSYPLCSALMLAGVLFVGFFMKSITKGKYEGIYMLSAADRHRSCTDYTLSRVHSDISSFTHQLKQYCRENGIDGKKANLAAVACEEVCVYFDKAVSAIDIMVYLNEDSVVMDFRALGEPSDFLSVPHEAYSSIDVLLKIAKEVRYEYVIGMNLTKVRL